MADCEVLLPTPEPSLLTARELAVIQDGDFFVPYMDELHEVFVALGRVDNWSDDPDKLCEYMLPAWFGGEHLTTKGKDQFTKEQERAARGVLAEAGFTRRITVPYGTVVDDTALYGASEPTNIDRMVDVRDSRENRGLVTPSVRLLMGETRPRIAADGTNEEILRSVFPDGNVPEENRWLQEQLKSGQPFPNETDLGRVAINCLVEGGGLLVPHRTDLSFADRSCQRLPRGIRYVEDGVEKVTPVRDVMDQHFVAADGLVVTLINAAPDPNRTWGAPRHTTYSCTRELNERYPVPQNGTLLVAVSNPYGIRMAQDVRAELDRAGRTDIRVMLSAAAMRDSMPIHPLLGTLASLTHLDVQRNYQRER